jgi:hypothetical protein
VASALARGLLIRTSAAPVRSDLQRRRARRQIDRFADRCGA